MWSCLSRECILGSHRIHSGLFTHAQEDSEFKMILTYPKANSLATTPYDVFILGAVLLETACLFHHDCCIVDG
jgi:hypothetical protein